MKLTPLDIHHKEFHRAIRGYNEEEVDDFLDEVAEEFERLFKENIDLKEQIEKAKERAGQFEDLQSTIQNVLITAQKSADEVLAQAKRDAEQIIRDAEVKARGLIEEASRGKESLEARFSDLKNAEREFREQFKSMLESYLRLVEGEMARPETSYQIPESSPAQEAEAPPAEQGSEESSERGVEADDSAESEGAPTDDGAQGLGFEQDDAPSLPGRSAIENEGDEEPIENPVLEENSPESMDSEADRAGSVFVEKSDL